MLEAELPLDIDQLHSVCVPIGDGSLAVCCARRSDLESNPQELLSLTPDRFPEFIPQSDLVARLNLLVGEFEPRSAKTSRNNRHFVAAAMVVLFTLFVGLGLIRRIHHWNSTVTSARLAADATMRNVSIDGVRHGDDLRAIDAELARLASVQAIMTDGGPPLDAASELAGLLRAWPFGTSSTPQTISIGSDGVSVSVTIEGDAAPFLKAFKAPPGWSLDEPRLSVSGTLSRVILHLQPSKEPRQ